MHDYLILVPPSFELLYHRRVVSFDGLHDKRKTSQTEERELHRQIFLLRFYSVHNDRSTRNEKGHQVEQMIT